MKKEEIRKTKYFAKGHTAGEMGFDSRLAEPSPFVLCHKFHEKQKGNDDS